MSCTPCCDPGPILPKLTYSLLIVINDDVGCYPLNLYILWSDHLNMLKFSVSSDLFKCWKVKILASLWNYRRLKRKISTISLHINWFSIWRYIENKSNLLFSNTWFWNAVFYGTKFHLQLNLSIKAIDRTVVLMDSLTCICSQSVILSCPSFVHTCTTYLFFKLLMMDYNWLFTWAFWMAIKVRWK